MEPHCKKHGYIDERTRLLAECPYCEIDRLKQYEEAITSAIKGLVLLWNFTDTDCTVVKHSYWLAHLEKIEKLEKALQYYAQPETYYIDFKNMAGLPTVCVDNGSIARAALEI